VHKKFNSRKIWIIIISKMELLDDALTNTNNAFSVSNFDNFSIQNVKSKRISMLLGFFVKLIFAHYSETSNCHYGQTYKSWEHWLHEILYKVGAHIDSSRDELQEVSMKWSLLHRLVKLVQTEITFSRLEKMAPFLVKSSIFFLIKHS